MRVEQRIWYADEHDVALVRALVLAGGIDGCEVRRAQLAELAGVWPGALGWRLRWLQRFGYLHIKGHGRYVVTGIPGLGAEHVIAEGDET